MIEFTSVTSLNFADYESIIQKLDLECFPNDYWEQKDWLPLLQNYQLMILLIMKDHRFVGFLAFSDIDNESEIFKIGVVSSYRNQQLGEKLLDQMKTHFKGREKRVFLEVRSDNHSAIALYQKYQFNMIGRRKDYYKIPVADALIFQLNIPLC